jgi:hypothetical protein
MTHLEECEHDWGGWHVVAVDETKVWLVGQCLRGNCQATIEGAAPVTEYTQEDFDG